MRPYARKTPSSTYPPVLSEALQQRPSRIYNVAAGQLDHRRSDRFGLHRRVGQITLSRSLAPDMVDETISGNGEDPGRRTAQLRSILIRKAPNREHDLLDEVFGERPFEPSLTIIGLQSRRKGVEQLCERRSTSILDDRVHERHMIDRVDGSGQTMIHTTIYAWLLPVASRRKQSRFAAKVASMRSNACNSR